MENISFDLRAKTTMDYKILPFSSLDYLDDRLATITLPFLLSRRDPYPDELAPIDRRREERGGASEVRAFMGFSQRMMVSSS